MRSVDIAGALGVVMLAVGLWWLHPSLMLCVGGVSLIVAAVRLNRANGVSK